MATSACLYDLPNTPADDNEQREHGDAVHGDDGVENRLGRTNRGQARKHDEGDGGRNQPQANDDQADNPGCKTAVGRAIDKLRIGCGDGGADVLDCRHELP